MRSPDNSSKLFIARDIKNSPEREAPEVVRAADKKFSKYQFYIGVRWHGSSIKGNSLPEGEGSDIDLRILYDEEKSDVNSLLESEFLDEVDRADKDLGKKTRKVDVTPYPIDLSRISEWLSAGEISIAATRIAQLSGLIKGERVGQYRKAIKELVSNRPDREELIQEIASTLIFEENRSKQKIQERRGINKEEFDKMQAQRRGLWVARLRKLYE